MFFIALMAALLDNGIEMKGLLYAYPICLLRQIVNTSCVFA